MFLAHLRVYVSLHVIPGISWWKWRIIHIQSCFKCSSTQPLFPKSRQRSSWGATYDVEYHGISWKFMEYLRASASKIPWNHLKSVISTFHQQQVQPASPASPVPPHFCCPLGEDTCSLAGNEMEEVKETWLRADRWRMVNGDERWIHRLQYIYIYLYTY